jgi:hypothetical protein
MPVWIPDRRRPPETTTPGGKPSPLKRSAESTPPRVSGRIPTLEAGIGGGEAKR